MSTPQTIAASNIAFSPLSIARTVWKRKLIIIGFWAAITTVVIAVVYRLPAVYQADALILVDTQKIPDKFVLSTVNADLQDRITNLSQQILSSTRLKKIIDDYGLYSVERKTLFEEEILNKMHKDIVIKLEPGYNRSRPGAFRISYQGADAAIAAQVTNRIAGLFIEENLRTREVQAQGTSEFIDTQLQDAKKSLDQLEMTVSEYKSQHNGELPQQENSIVSSLSRLQLELQANRDAVNRLQASQVMLESTFSTSEATLAALTVAADNRNGVVPGSSTLASVPADPVARARQSLEARQAELDLLRLRFGPLYPDVKRKEMEIAQLKAEKVRQENGGGASPQDTLLSAAPAVSTTRPRTAGDGNLREVLDVSQLNERLGNLTTQIALTNKELELRKSDQARILRDMSTYEARLSRLPLREQEMAQITRDYEMSKANYKSLFDKKSAAGMANDMEHRQKSESFVLLDAATVPGKPQRPNQPLFLDLGGSLLGLSLGVAVAMIREKRRDLLLGEWELPAEVHVLGRLPYIVVYRGKPGTAEEPPQAGWRFRPRLKMAVLSSIVICALGAAAAGWFVVSQR